MVRWTWFAGFLAVVTAARADEVATWPQYGGTGRDFVCSKLAKAGSVQSRLWRRDLGPGTSGIVTEGRSLFTMYSVPDPKKIFQGEEIVVCLDPVSGKTRWEHRYAVARLNGQQSYTGEPICPHATPALHGDRVCTLGYTGLLKCFDTTGKVQWEYDLVKDFEATPVQFGFSASPLAVGGRFLVHVGGKQSAVVAFDAANGKVAWRSKAAEPGYSSPVVLPGEGSDEIVQVTRDAIVGLAANDGHQKWSYPLPKTGLTNVPTPLVLPKRRLLVSGQGVLGTRLLEVSTTESGQVVNEVWKNEKVVFFYSNWLVDGEAVYGAHGQFFGGLSLADGKELWRERGQQDANLLQAGVALILRGDGRLTRAQLSRTGLESLDTYELLKGRCWTAPTYLGNVLYARSEKEITAVKLAHSK